MSTAQTFWVTLGVLLVGACLVISTATFGRLWFVDRLRLQAKMREALGRDHEPVGFSLISLWSGLQAFLVILLGVLCVIGVGIVSLFWVPLVYAWYRVRGKPLPKPNMHFDNED